MNKLTCILFGMIIILSIGAVHPSSKDEQLPNLYNKSLPSVVRINGFDEIEIMADVKIKRPSFGTGFIIDKSRGLIVTAYHIEFLLDKEIILLNNLIVSCETVAIDKENDIAILKVNPEYLKDTTEVNFTRRFKIGQRIFSIGNPRGFNNIFNAGFVSSNICNKTLEIEIFPNKFIVVDIDFDGGSSGSPVFDVNNKVIGMAIIISGEQGVIVPSFLIQKLIDSI